MPVARRVVGGMIAMPVIAYRQRRRIIPPPTTNSNTPPWPVSKPARRTYLHALICPEVILNLHATLTSAVRTEHPSRVAGAAINKPSPCAS
jgi:hypothetical protein